MSIVSFDVSSSDAETTLVVEAHGSVYQPQEFAKPITQVDAFYMTYRLNENLDPELTLNIIYYPLIIKFPVFLFTIS